MFTPYVQLDESPKSQPLRPSDQVKDDIELDLEAKDFQNIFQQSKILSNKSIVPKIVEGRPLSQKSTQRKGQEVPNQPQKQTKRPGNQSPKEFDIFQEDISEPKPQNDNALTDQVDYQDIIQDDSSSEEELPIPQDNNVRLNITNFFGQFFNQTTLRDQIIQDRINNKLLIRGALRKRSATRIIYLLFITSLCFVAFYILSKYYTQYQDTLTIQPNSNLYLNITNCKFTIIDIGIPSQNETTQNPVSQHNIKSNSSKRLKIQQKSKMMEIHYDIPGRFSIDTNSQTSQVSSEIKNQDYRFVFDNVLSRQNCEIQLFVYAPISMKDLQINCQGICSIMVLSQQISFQNVSINGSHIEANIQSLDSNYISYHSIKGRFQGNYLKFKTGDIRLQEGDIIVQSDQDLMVNWTHSLPNYCFGSPVVENPIVIGCQEPPQQEIELYMSGKGTTHVKNSISPINKSNSLTEKFADDQEEDPQVLLNPSFSTYKGSKSFQESPQETTTKPKMKRKSNEYKTTEKPVFQPSCYGNTILCKSPDCYGIKEPVIKKYQKHYRTLEETQENVSSIPEQPTNKTKKPNYKALAKEASEKLPQNIPDGIRFMNLTGRFGNIYVNLIQQKQQRIQTSDTLMHGQSYDINNITFDLPTQKRMNDLLRQSRDAHNFDATFIFQIGSKDTQSDNFQQWTTTKNPAYSYIRPWTIGSYSFTLMSTSTWTVESNLSPGFCPYIPQVDLNDIYNTGYMIKQIFKDDLNAITTINWQKGVLFPQQYQESQTGVRRVDLTPELWLDISKVNDTSYSLTQIDLASSLATWWAALFSYIAALLVGAIAFVIVLYLVNYAYIDIIKKVSQSAKYTSIENKNDDLQNQPLMPEESNQNTQSSKQAPNELNNDDTYLLEGDSNVTIEQNQLNKTSKPQNQDELEINLTLNPVRLLYQIMELAPPLSAFIDYYCLLIRKQFTNSVDEFYHYVFTVQKVDQQIHDLSTEEISGNKFKTLYEKFCYLNGILERKLDDPQNISKLSQRGFKIETREDTQAECYTRVIITGIIPNVVPQVNQLPLDLFITNCCKISKFEEDNITVQMFNEQFQEFCVINHLQFKLPLISDLQKYHITSKFIAQQWIIREEHDKSNELYGLAKQIYECLICARFRPQKNIQVINQRKIENHFALLTNRFEQIKTGEELTETYMDLILYRGWWLDDFLTVLVQFLTTLILVLSLFVFDTLTFILYSQFSLKPSDYLITWEDVIEDPLCIFKKMFLQNYYVMLSATVYWIYLIFDLLYYQCTREFPQEKSFKVKRVGLVEKIYRNIMWLQVLYSVFKLCYHFALAVVWLILGAIVNPAAFLPYATASATFITVITSKASQYKKIALDGFDTVITVIQNTAQKQMGNMISKFELKGKFHIIMQSQIFKDITAKAQSLGIIDHSTIKDIDAMLDDPNKLIENTMSKVQEITKDPSAYALQLAKKIEDQGTSIIREQISKQDDIYGSQLAEIIIAVFKKDKKLFKQNITELIQLAANQNQIDALKTLDTSIMNIIWDFAYPGHMQSYVRQEYFSQITLAISDIISQFLLNKVQERYPMFQKDSIKVILQIAISLQSNSGQMKPQNLLQHINQIIKLTGAQPFDDIKNLDKFMQFLELELIRLESKFAAITFKQIKQIISGLFQQNAPEIKPIEAMLDILEIIINISEKNTKQYPVNQIQEKVQACIDQLKPISSKYPVDNVDDKVLQYSMTMAITFMQNSGDKIPQECLNFLIIEFLKNNPDFQSNKNPEDTERMRKLLSKVFHLMTFFMESNKELTTTLHKAARKYSLDETSAIQIQEVFKLRNLKYTTYDGSPQENTLYNSLKSNKIISNISNTLQFEITLTLGVISVLMDRWNRQEIQSLYEYVAKINKIEIFRVKQFFAILILFRSRNEEYLINALYELQIPKKYLILILIGKGMVSKQFINFTDMEQFIHNPIMLGDLKKSKTLQRLIDQLYKYIKANKGKSTQSQGISEELLMFLLTELDQQHEIHKNTLVNYLKIIGNNKNTFTLLKQFEINLLEKILKMRSIAINSSDLDSSSKQGISSFGYILNVKYEYLEDICNIIFLNNAENCVQSIMNLQKNGFVIISQSFTIQFQELIAFMFDRYYKLQRREQFLENQYTTIFERPQLPIRFVNKLIFNEQIKLDSNSIYQLAKVILKTQNEELVVKSLHIPISFMNSTIETPVLLQAFKAESGHEFKKGMTTIISMLNETSKLRASELFLDYLKSNQDLPQVYSVFAHLYLFFSGQSHVYEMGSEQTQPNSNVLVSYLSNKLDIEIEFFQALHTFFQKDNQKFTEYMIKFMRKRQACKLSKDDPEMKVPLQSLVRIPQSHILNFINLITKENYQTIFFSEELKIDHNILLLVDLFRQIKYSSDSKQRQQHLSQLKDHELILRNLQIDAEELQIIISLLFQDLTQTQLLQIYPEIEKTCKIQLDDLQMLLRIDRIIDQREKVSLNILRQQIIGNTLLTQMELNQEIVLIVKGLARGMFGQMDHYIRSMPNFDYSKSNKLNNLMAGLVGAISGQIPDDFNVNQYLRELSEQLKNPNKTSTYFNQGTNEIKLAYYYLTDKIRINPMVLLLTQNILPAWKTLYQIYNNVLDRENKWLNPIIVFQLILTTHAMPTLIKEIYTEQEWYNLNSKQLDGSDSDFIKQGKKLKIITEKILDLRFRNNKEMENVSRQYGINQEIFEYVVKHQKNWDIKAIQLQFVADSLDLIVGALEQNLKIVENLNRIIQFLNEQQKPILLGTDMSQFLKSQISDQTQINNLLEKVYKIDLQSNYEVIAEGFSQLLNEYKQQEKYQKIEYIQQILDLNMYEWGEIEKNIQKLIKNKEDEKWVQEQFEKICKAITKLYSDELKAIEDNKLLKVEQSTIIFNLNNSSISDKQRTEFCQAIQNKYSKLFSKYDKYLIHNITQAKLQLFKQEINISKVQDNLKDKMKSIFAFLNENSKYSMEDIINQVKNELDENDKKLLNSEFEQIDKRIDQQVQQELRDLEQEPIFQDWKAEIRKKFEDLKLSEQDRQVFARDIKEKLTIPSHLTKYLKKSKQVLMREFMIENATSVITELDSNYISIVTLRRLRTKIIKEAAQNKNIKSLESIIYENALSQQERNNLLSIQGEIYYSGLSQCYQELQGLFIDPRFKDINAQSNSKLLDQSLITANLTMHFTLGVCTSLAKLRHIYQSQENQNKSQALEPIVAQEIDYILTSIERLYWFEESLETFSKPRAILLLGLAAGYIITPEHMIHANCTASIAEFKTKKSQSKSPILQKQDIVIQMLQCRNQIESVGIQLFKEYNYDKISDYQSDIYFQPNLYLIDQHKQYGVFNWENLLLDNPCKKISECNENVKTRLNFEQIKWTNTFMQKKNYRKIQLLLDICKCNYQSLIKNQDIQFLKGKIERSDAYYSLIGLSGCHYKNNIRYVDFQQYINVCNWIKKSNQRNLAEILSLFIHDFQEISSLTQLCENPDALLNFIKLSLGLKRDQQMQQLKKLVSLTSLNDENQIIQLELIEFYVGRVDLLYDLAKHSEFIATVSGDVKLKSVKKVLKRILYGFDKQELHKYEVPEWSSFNFHNKSIYSEDTFTQLIWQLAQSVTKQDISELTLPILSENEIQTQNAIQQKYLESKKTILPIQQLIIALLEEDYSYFFKDNTKDTLKRLQIIEEEKQIKLIQALIGLKTTKINAVIAEQDTKQIPINMQMQIEALMESPIMQGIKDSNQRRQLSQLLLSLVNGSIFNIFNAIIQNDNITGSYIMTLYTWKHLREIFSYEKDNKQQVLTKFINFLPILVKIQLQNPNENNFEQFAKEFQNALQDIEESLPSSELFEKIQTNTQILEKEPYQFHWTLWSKQIYEYKQADTFLQFLTGYSIVQKMQSSKYSTLLSYYRIPNLQMLKQLNNNDKQTQNQETMNPDIDQAFDMKGTDIIRIFLTRYFSQEQKKVPKQKATLQNESQDIKTDLQEPLNTLYSFYCNNQTETIVQELLASLKTLINQYETILSPSLEQPQLDTTKQIKLNIEKLKYHIRMKLSNESLENLLIKIKPDYPDLVQKILDLNLKIANITANNQLLKNHLLNIYDLIINQKNDQSKQIFKLVDNLLFKSLQIDQYVNTTVIKSIHQAIQSVVKQPINQMTNPEFVNSILLLICEITGQDIPENLQTNPPILRSRTKLIELPINFINHIFLLSRGELNSIPQLLIELKVSESTVKFVQKIIEQVQNLGAFGQEIKLPQISLKDTKKTQEIQELMKKIEQGTATASDMFKAIDMDGSNSISKDEFNILSRRLGMNLSEHRTNEIFASIKKQELEQSLNEAEFQKAMTYLQSKNTHMALNFLGISPSILTMWLIVLAVTLLMIFVFIFFGIQAFALGGTFGAIINSILPMIAGAGASSKTEKLGDKDISETPVTEVVEKTQKIIQSDQI